MSRKDAIRCLAKDFVKFVEKEEQKDKAFDAWHAKLETDLARQIKYELENLHEVEE